VIVRLKRAVERANRTHIAVAIQQRVANRTRSSVCRFHKPWPGFLPIPSSANLASEFILDWFAWKSRSLDRNRPFAPSS
jgi:hypothetical protein